MRIELSKRGLPCVWEQGGAGRNTGDSRVVGDMHGNPKKAIYVRRSGHLSNGEHALIPIREKDIIVESSQWRGDYSTYIYRVKSIDTEEMKAELELVNSFTEGEWDRDLKEEHRAIVEAAERKAGDYHCRSAYYVKEERR